MLHFIIEDLWIFKIKSIYLHVFYNSINHITAAFPRTIFIHEDQFLSPESEMINRRTTMRGIHLKVGHFPLNMT